MTTSESTSISAKRILVTGGAGFIGSHTVVELLGAGYAVVVLDNFCNSKPEVIRRIAQIAGQPVEVVRGDVRDRPLLKQLLADGAFYGVIHFAGLKAVGESVAEPLRYYDNNVAGSLALVETMAEARCLRLVFSSSATVYGAPHAVPVDESFPLAPINPYGSTKRIVEDLLRDVARSNAQWRIALLRYFNPVGAHASGLIGEDPAGIPNNLMPFVSQVASGRQPVLTVNGCDYPTRDGTGERDYIHVVDLARGHVAALAAIDRLDGAIAINLGTGRGTTVAELIAAFERASGRTIAQIMGPRRLGDVPRSFADCTRARTLLGWTAGYDLARMCEDVWRWQSANPMGYPQESE